MMTTKRLTGLLALGFILLLALACTAQQRAEPFTPPEPTAAPDIAATVTARDRALPQGGPEPTPVPANVSQAASEFAASYASLSQDLGGGTPGPGHLAAGSYLLRRKLGAGGLAGFLRRFQRRFPRRRRPLPAPVGQRHVRPANRGRPAGRSRPSPPAGHLAARRVGTRARVGVFFVLETAIARETRTRITALATRWPRPHSNPASRVWPRPGPTPWPSGRAWRTR